MRSTDSAPMRRHNNRRRPARAHRPGPAVYIHRTTNTGATDSPPTSVARSTTGRRVRMYQLSSSSRSSHHSKIIIPHETRSHDDCFVGLLQVWTTLPPEVTSAPSLASFRARLETFLFTESYPVIRFSSHFGGHSSGLNI